MDLQKEMHFLCAFVVDVFSPKRPNAKQILWTNHLFRDITYYLRTVHANTVSNGPKSGEEGL